jgi:hypothetical protein
VDFRRIAWTAAVALVVVIAYQNYQARAASGGARLRAA